MPSQPDFPRTGRRAASPSSLSNHALSRRSFLTAMAAASTTAASAQAPAAPPAPRSGPPNILFILADDLGYTAVRSYGGRHAKTPHLDRLAKQGIRFTDAYVTPQCTPTRASLLTGQHTARNRMWHVIPPYGYPYAPLKEPPYKANMERGTCTIAAALRDAGYTTAILGKWHLTRNDDGYYTMLYPEAATHYGFDYAPSKQDPLEYQSHTDKGVDFLTNETIAFIERSKDRPFFAYLSHHTIHGPVLAPKDLTDAYRKRGYLASGIHNATYLAALEHMDASIGRLLAKLDELNLASNTIVVFLSDNGGIDTLFDNAPLRLGKGSPYEGGIRVPAIVRWPGVTPEGADSSVPVHVVDWYPTLLEAAGARAPAPTGPKGHPLDGVSLLPALRGGSLPERTLYWYMPLYDIQWGATPCAVIREGDYKLIHFFGDHIDPERDYALKLGERVELYNLKDDIGEQRDLALREEERAAAMKRKLRAWLQSLGAPMPTPNPAYDAADPFRRP
ncbi:MAG: sulfatase [Bryobacterales bacterium]|nr:sulfatase [Bryobacterales bacterium]